MMNDTDTQVNDVNAQVNDVDAHVADYELICVIVNFGLGSKILHSAKHCGITGGTISLGKGTVNNHILEFLGLSDVRKEIVYMVGDQKTAEETLDKLDAEFKFEKPNHGIAFTTLVSKVLGNRGCKSANLNKEKGVGTIMYEAITVVVDKGQAEFVIEAASKAGSKGGTIINARGSGIHEISKVFAMDIEPEKEIVLILTKVEQTEQIVASIREQLKIDEPGRGIIFVQDVNRAYGLYE